MEAATSYAAFDACAVDATLAGSPVTVVLDRDVELQDVNGDISGRVTTADFKTNVVTSWTEGQLLTVGSENFRLAEEIANDGYIMSILCHPVTV
ncbi:hypothetical protein F3N42_03665 [Marinihelvus fidelis]|uniref:Uncharacterized protein n=1 Tax=Marinihelvus fidelis TaxID=2613842 RepID=A0A5N0TEP7_9GAMM|nr:hypothetical protein [Marinihelvus fidelis]KAA9133460.1 hypothetical protein F3N42_03665 [Marinihelvus fidelis]